MPRIIKPLLYTAGILLVLLTAGYFIANGLIHKKVDEALRTLPPSLHITYTSLHPGILSGSLVINGLAIRFSPGANAGEGQGHVVSIERLDIGGIRFWALLTSHQLRVRTVRLEGCSASLDEDLLEKNIPFPTLQLPFTETSIDRLELTDLNVKGHKKEKELFSLKGRLELDSVRIAKERDTGEGPGTGDVKIGGIRLLAEKIHYTIPGADETVQLSHLELDSKKSMLGIDTLRIVPTLGKVEIGQQKGHQVDVVEASIEGISIERLDVMALPGHRLVADQINIHHSNIHVFRDRRLPLEAGNKPFPVKSLKSVPLSLRVQLVKFGVTTFTYEEFPKKGDKTGALKIERLSGTLSPLINQPVAGDPDYLTLVTKGSLMGSGLVTSTMKMPLRKGDPYLVEGAFHELDVTMLNPSAENLGKLHLESGMLNSLTFAFRMTEEKATGQVLGEYHNLVVDKLKEKSDDKKVDRLKSFFLKTFIIPKDKDRSLPESKRTGKVNYKHDPGRYFSYYLLHSLLVGVKSSFKLGFLLPG